jgi:hypothetical protein
MAEAKVFTFTYQELAEMMVRKLGLSEGLWGIYVRFGLQATNVGPGPEDLRPAAILPVLEVGVQRVDEPSSLAVDAAALRGSSPPEARSTSSLEQGIEGALRKTKSSRADARSARAARGR